MDPAAKVSASRPKDIDPIALVVLIYHFLLNRNPDPAGFAWCLEKLRGGYDPLRLFAECSQTDEVAASLRHNPYFRRLGGADGAEHRRSSSVPEMPWKAEDRPAVVDYPFSLFNIELTNRCPFRCVMCPRTHHMTRAEGLMEIGLFRKIIDQLADSPLPGKGEEVWLHHFGESLVHPEVGHFIRYAQGRGIGAKLSINPLMLSEKFIDELLEVGPVELYISLDGHDDASFARIRGLGGVYDKSKSNLMRFLNRKIELGAETRITLSVIDFPLNEKSEESKEKREEWARQWEKIPGIDQFIWKPFTSWNGDAEEIVELERHGGQSSEAYRNARDGYFKVTCEWPWKKMTVTWNGDVVPCCYDYDGKYVLGNASRQTLAEIWNGPRMQELRREFASNHVTNPLCRSCSALYLNPP